MTQQALVDGSATRRPGSGFGLGARSLVRSRGAWELGLVMVLDVAYSASRLLADGSMTPAVERAGDLLRLEGRLVVDWESTLNGDERLRRRAGAALCPGWWGGDASAPKGLGGLTNQLAALPSLHAGWALWVAMVLQRHAPSPWWCWGSR